MTCFMISTLVSLNCKQRIRHWQSSNVQVVRRCENASFFLCGRRGGYENSRLTSIFSLSTGDSWNILLFAHVKKTNSLDGEIVAPLFGL